MKLVTFTNRAGTQPDRLGLLGPDGVVDLDAAFGLFRDELDRPGGLARFPDDMPALLSLGTAGLGLAEAIGAMATRTGAAILAPGTWRLLAPVTRPPKIVCVGLNYVPVAEKMAFRPGEGAPIFLKATSAVVGPGASIVLPWPDVGPLAAEIELGVVIGRPARHIAASQAFDVVAGYTIIIDVTANDMMSRDAYQFRRAGENDTTHAVFFRAKDFDTFAPLGPALVTRDEIADESVRALAIEASANGELFVQGNTRDMIIGVPELIEFITSVLTLLPGDVVATGHPGHLQPRLLAAGEEIEARIAGLGALRVQVEEAKG